jgi:hypothetical protein
VVEPFVLKNEPAYPILCQGTHGAYSSGGVPHAYLICPEGKVLWSGHPASLSDGDLEGHLKAVDKANRVSTWAFTIQKQLPEIPASLSGLDKMLVKMQFGAALKKVDAVLAKAEGDEKTAVEAVHEFVAKKGTEGLEKAANLARDGKPYKAFVLYGEIESLYKGHDFSAQAKNAAKALTSDKATGLEIAAAEKLAEARKAMALEKDPEDKLKVLKPVLSKKYEETEAGKEAAKLAAELEGQAK